MNLKKSLVSLTAFLFICGSMAVMTGSVYANPHKNGMPPGLAKKQVDAENEYEHPSVKGLKNAYKNGNKSERAREVLRQKIENRGGEVPSEETSEEKEFSISVSGDIDAALEPGQEEELVFVIEDKDGNKVDLEDGYKIELQVNDEDEVLVSPEEDIELDMSNDTGVTEVVGVEASDENEGTATIDVVLYDAEGEELDSVESKFTVGEHEVTSGEFDSTDEHLAFSTEIEDEKFFVVPAEENFELSYNILDQFGNEIEVTEDVTVGFTIENEAKEDIMKEVEREIEDGSSSCSIKLKAEQSIMIKVIAEIEEEDIEETATIVFYSQENELASNADVEINGVVEAFKENDEKEEGMDILVRSEDDYYYIPSSVLFEEEKPFEVGDEVTIELDANEEDEDNDEDKISNNDDNNITIE